MIRKLGLATGILLAVSGIASAQPTNPYGVPSRSSGPTGPIGPTGIGPDMSPRVPPPAMDTNSDPRRYPSGTRPIPGPMGVTGGVDAGSAVSGATDTITGNSPAMGAGNLNRGGGIGTGGTLGGGPLTGGLGAPLPGAGSLGGSAPLGTTGTGNPGAGMGGAGAGTTR